MEAGSSDPLRLVVQRPPTAVLTGQVVGMPDADVLVMRMVTAESAEGKTAFAPVGATGTFRMEEAPAGRVRVRALVSTLQGVKRSSKATEVVLAPGAEAETVVEFSNGLVVRGSVTRAGAPLAGALVSFLPKTGDAAQSTARAEAGGQYEVVGLEPGRYAVTVDRKSTRLNSSHIQKSRMPSSA